MKEKSVDTDFYKNRSAKDGVASWCRLCMKASNRQWHDKNIGRHREMNRIWYQAHKESKHARRMERIHTNPKARLIHNLRARMHEALGSNKTDKTVNLLGCSVPFLKTFLEAQFIDGMSWENYGDWHIDHVIPMASIDIDDEESIRRICHYTNLRPLWAEDNLKKGCRVEL